MTVDREQVRRDAERVISDIENVGYATEAMYRFTESMYRFAETCLALLTELQQAERERDYEALSREEGVREGLDDVRFLLEKAEARLANVPALVDALRKISNAQAWYAPIAREALASWESETESRATEREDTQDR